MDCSFELLLLFLPTMNVQHFTMAFILIWTFIEHYFWHKNISRNVNIDSWFTLNNKKFTKFKI